MTRELRDRLRKLGKALSRAESKAPDRYDAVQAEAAARIARRPPFSAVMKDMGDEHGPAGQIGVVRAWFDPARFRPAGEG